MKAVSRVHITPHMHWDREWYFTTEESRILLVNNMEEILCRLEQDNEYKYYVLDGQTAILEDYFAVKPENKDRVKKQVEAGKLIIGPWYTQTDTTIVSAESIVRNLMYGMRDCLAFGEPMKIGYLPDSFGMSGQLPHIYNGFGITHQIDALFDALFQVSGKLLIQTAWFSDFHMRSRHDTADYICYTTFASLALLAVMKKPPEKAALKGN